MIIVLERARLIWTSLAAKFTECTQASKIEIKKRKERLDSAGSDDTASMIS